MATPPLTDEECAEAADFFKKVGSVAGGARAAGMPTGTFKNRLRHAARRGLMGTRPVLPGFEIKQTSTQRGPDGEIQREWIQQKPESGAEFEVPKGHVVKGVSALTGPNGELLAQWIKTREDNSTADVVAAIETVFAAYKGAAVLPPSPVAAQNADLATVYVLSDHHLGMFSWSKETGEDYDLKIGEKLLLGAMRDLVANAPAAETAVVLNLGDFFHSDNASNRTELSGNALDVDTRYAKVLQLGVKLNIECIELALQKHARVIVRCLPGNHDPHTALALSVALSAFFADDNRVEVDCDPSFFFRWRFGKVLIAATHGHMVKPEDMPGLMASKWSKDWGETAYRYAYFGHVHHRSRGGGEKHGVVWETFQTLAAKDAWHAASGYTSGRSMTAITHHKMFGETFRHTVAVPLPKTKGSK